MNIPGKFISTKLLLILIVILISTTFLIVDACTFEEWSLLIKWIVGIYVVGNVSQKFTKGETKE